MIDETINPWKTMIKETVYDNNWITVTHEQVINPTAMCL